MVAFAVALQPNCGDGDGDGGSEPHPAALGAPRARPGSHHDFPNSRHSSPVSAQEELHCSYCNGRRQQQQQCAAMATPALGRPSVHSKVPSRRLCQQKLQLGSSRLWSAGGREAAAREGVRCGVAASLVPTGYPKAAGEWGLGFLIVLQHWRCFDCLRDLKNWRICRGEFRVAVELREVVSQLGIGSFCIGVGLDG